MSGAIRRSVQTEQCTSLITYFKLNNILTRLSQQKHFPAFGKIHNNFRYIVNVTIFCFFVEKVKCASVHKQIMTLQIQQVLC